MPATCMTFRSYSCDLDWSEDDAANAPTRSEPARDHPCVLRVLPTAKARRQHHHRRRRPPAYSCYAHRASSHRRASHRRPHRAHLCPRPPRLPGGLNRAWNGLRVRAGRPSGPRAGAAQRRHHTPAQSRRPLQLRSPRRRQHRRSPQRPRPHPRHPARAFHQRQETVPLPPGHHRRQKACARYLRVGLRSRPQRSRRPSPLQPAPLSSAAHLVRHAVRRRARHAAHPAASFSAASPRFTRRQPRRQGPRRAPHRNPQLRDRKEGRPRRRARHRPRLRSGPPSHPARGRRARRPRLRQQAPPAASAATDSFALPFAASGSSKPPPAARRQSTEPSPAPRAVPERISPSTPRATSRPTRSRTASSLHSCSPSPPCREPTKTQARPAAVAAPRQAT